VAEYFWLYLLGLSCAVVVGQSSVPRALIGLLLGLLFSTVGLSAVHAQARFTFGQTELYQGINFIPAMIGLFGLSEVLRNVAALRRDQLSPTVVAAVKSSEGILGPAWRTQKTRWGAWLRSCGIGAGTGVLPGAGADIAAWVSTAASKRARRQTTETPSDAASTSIADACSANSASLAGAWIPALVFGIPGDSITAIVIGVLYMKNLKPGPEIFDQQGALVYSIYLVFVLANLVLLPVGLLAIRAGGFVMRLPRPILLPIIVLFCIVGAYAVNGSLFDVGLMLGFGVLGLFCERHRISLGAMVLGIILGGPLEERFVQTLSGGQGNLLAFIERPVAASLALLCLLIWGSLPFRAWLLRNHKKINGERGT
jgi:putative tricarboxylic transport membrane protein